MNDQSSWQKASPRSRDTRPQRKLTATSAGDSIGARLLATGIGGTAGLLSCLGWVLFYPWPREPDAWSLTGPGIWWVSIGALLGLIGGLPFARAMLDHALDGTRSDASFGVVLGLVVILVVGCGLAIFWFSTR